MQGAGGAGAQRDAAMPSHEPSQVLRRGHSEAEAKLGVTEDELRHAPGRDAPRGDCVDSFSADREGKDSLSNRVQHSVVVDRAGLAWNPVERLKWNPGRRGKIPQVLLVVDPSLRDEDAVCTHVQMGGAVFGLCEKGRGEPMADRIEFRKIRWTWLRPFAREACRTASGRRHGDNSIGGSPNGRSVTPAHSLFPSRAYRQFFRVFVSLSNLE